MMVNFIANAFSLQMISNDKGSIKYTVISEEEFDEIKYKALSFVGHTDTAKLLGVKCHRGDLTLQKGDTLYVAQLIGGRLPEGCLKLPLGRSFKYFKISLE